MVKKYLSLFFLLFSVFQGFSQEKSYNIKARLKGVDDHKYVYLAHYFGNNQYVKIDSALVSDGQVEFKKDKDIRGGIYLLVLSKEKFYDFIWSGFENNIEISADTSQFLKTVKFKNSKENDVLYEYRRFLQKQSVAAEKVDKKLKDKSLTKEEAQAKMKDLQKEVADYMKEIIANNEKLFVAKVIKANIEVEIPTEIPLLPNGKKDSTFTFNYYKNHYFDNVDFKDVRMLNTPFLQTKVDNYFKSLVYMVPDSAILDCDRVLAKTKSDQDVYRYFLWEITDKFEKSEVVGMETVAVHLMKNHYLKYATWLDSSATARFAQRVRTLEPILPGKTFPTLILMDSMGVSHNIANIKSKYTIVIFYKHDCGHCQDQAPKLVEFIEKNKDRGVEVVMVDTENNLKKMNEFASKYKTKGLSLNLYDKLEKYNFYYDYDVYSTPTTYVLDKNKKILAKRIPVDDFGNYLDFLDKREKQK